MTPPLLASAIFAAHRADDALGDCEAGIRADEAARWLRCMSERRVG